MDTWVKNIFAVTLLVEDLEVSKQFYEKMFDLPVVYEDAVSAVFKMGDTLINLLHVSEADGLFSPAKVAGHDSGARCMFTIHVDDVDAMCAQLTTRGAKLLNGPMDRPWGVRTASFMDPGGHIWEIAK